MYAGVGRKKNYSSIWKYVEKHMLKNGIFIYIYNISPQMPLRSKLWQTAGFWGILFLDKAICSLEFRSQQVQLDPSIQSYTW